MASLTGGMAVSPARTSKLWESFGEGSRDLVERVEFSLWDSWIYFVILAGLLTAEWLLRKKGGIA